jgi:hypothetical protein
MEPRQTKLTRPLELAVLLGTAAMALVLDIESTKYAQHDSEAAEVNSWIYGERPSRARMYAVSVPVAVALMGYAGYLKASVPSETKNSWAWRVPLWGLSLGHAVAAAANFINFRKRPNHDHV